MMSVRQSEDRSVRDLLRIGRELGVSVHVAHLPGDLLGGWYPETARVFVRFGLTPSEFRSVLAHELGHVYYQHTCDDGPSEAQANLYAARLLIDDEAYVRAEAVSPHPHDIAEELGVTVELVQTYRSRCLTSVRGVTYTRPRLGIGQWDLRRAHA